MPVTIGSNFGPYRMVEPLGRGGMASVYKAYEPGLDRYIALKVLPQDSLQDSDFADRFTREAQVIARLEHRHIVPIYAFGIDDGIPWMAMRLVPGGALSSLLRKGRMDPARSVEVLAECAEAIDYAHERGVLHRDVKPQNVLIDEKGHVYLADFGIARLVESSAVFTRTGMIQGTPQYMSPEQARAETVDHRTDIYALGIVAYEMLTGRLPFTADTPVAVLMKHILDPIPLPSAAEVPEPMMRAILKSLAKEREDRWETATAFAAALRESLNAGSPHAGLPPTGTVGAIKDTPGRATLTLATQATRPRPGAGAARTPPVRGFWTKIVFVAIVGVVVAVASVRSWLGATGPAVSPERVTGEPESAAPPPSRLPDTIPTPSPLPSQAASQLAETLPLRQRASPSREIHLPSPTPSYVGPAPSPLAVEVASEEAEWAAIRNSADPTVFRNYLRRFPDGGHRAMAIQNLEFMEGNAAGPVPGAKEKAPSPPIPAPVRPEPDELFSQRVNLGTREKAKFVLLTADGHGINLTGAQNVVIPWPAVSAINTKGVFEKRLVIESSSQKLEVLCSSDTEGVASRLREIWERFKQ